MKLLLNLVVGCFLVAFVQADNVVDLTVGYIEYRWIDGYIDI